MNQLLSLQLWNLFKCDELTDVVRQSDQILLSNVVLGTIDEHPEGPLMTRFI